MLGAYQDRTATISMSGSVTGQRPAMIAKEFYGEVRRRLGFAVSDRQLRRYRAKIVEEKIEYTSDDVRKVTQLALLVKRYRNLDYAHGKFVELLEEEYRNETQRTINV